MITRIVIAFALGMLPDTARAQSSGAAVPVITLDGQLGGAHHPGRSGATYYNSENFQVARVAVTVRLGSRGALRPFVMLDYFDVWGMGDDLTLCRNAPNGTCIEYFPDVSGSALGLGVRAVFGRVSLGLGGGIGRYKMGPVDRLTGYHGDAELSLLFTKHTGAVVNVRHVETERFRGARMWFRPITVGLRIQ